MLTESSVREILQPFDLELSYHQVGQVLTYLDLLLRWNRKINLTGIRAPEECLTRHFGESLYLARWVELRGSLLDIGSGAGFPGLALKIVFPSLAATLLEPVGKKRAFLKEVARACEIERVEVRSERLQDFFAKALGAAFDACSARAVGKLRQLVPQAVSCLKPGGNLCLWLSHAQAEGLATTQPLVDWHPAIAVPLGRERVILVGTRAAAIRSRI